MDQFCCVCISLMSYGLRITWQDVNGAVQLQQHTNMESVNRMLAAGLTVQRCSVIPHCTVPVSAHSMRTLRRYESWSRHGQPVD